MGLPAYRRKLIPTNFGRKAHLMQWISLNNKRLLIMLFVDDVLNMFPVFHLHLSLELCRIKNCHLFPLTLANGVLFASYVLFKMPDIYIFL